MHANAVYQSHPMNNRKMGRMVRLLAGVATVVAAAAQPALAGDDAKKATPPAGSATLVGGALPGGAIISAKFAQLTPAAGGNPVTVPIASDGSFRFDGLKPGNYRFTVTSSKQTQNASFGEKVQSGLAQTGGALASGAAVAEQDAATSSAQAARLPDSTPARISTNFTVGKQTGRVTVDGPGVDIEVGADQSLSGRLSAATKN